MKDIYSKVACLSVVLVLSLMILINSVGAQNIDPSLQGLASELSEQAKVIAEQQTLIEGLQKRCSAIVAKDEALRKRVEQLELADVERTKRDAVQLYKNADVERRLKGVQEQITILHSSKADKQALQESRDQVARIIKQLK